MLNKNKVKFLVITKDKNTGILKYNNNIMKTLGTLHFVHFGSTAGV